MNWEYSVSVRAPTALVNSFDWCVDSRTARRRSTGSATLLATLTTIDDT